MDIRNYAMHWLSDIPGLGPKGREELDVIFADETDIFLSSGEEIYTRIKAYTREHGKRALTDKVVGLLADTGRRMASMKEYEGLADAGVRFISRYDPMYPKRLEGIYDPPHQLFVKGGLPGDGRVAVGIVGARNCTVYGRDMARLFGYRLARAGIDVISGMAAGVDGWAHRGALEAGGRTYAVLGCGVGVCYPESNRNIYEGIPQNGGLISEYPVRYKPLASNFPARNRIISGLSDGILIVEARLRSGSLITADAALDQGKDVFVIPGRIGDELSIGCNRLIRQGAIPVLTPDDILEYYNVRAGSVEPPGLTGDERLIYEMIGDRAVSITDIASKAQGSYAGTLKLLMKMKKNGLIKEVYRDKYVRV